MKTATSKWLRNVVPSLKLARRALMQLVRPKEFVKRVKVTVTMLPLQMDFDKLLMLTGIQNNLETKSWNVHNAKVLKSEHTVLVLWGGFCFGAGAPGHGRAYDFEELG